MSVCKYLVVKLVVSLVLLLLNISFSINCNKQTFEASFVGDTNKLQVTYPKRQIDKKGMTGEGGSLDLGKTCDARGVTDS
jgi:hypothetical protein